MVSDELRESLIQAVIDSLSPRTPPATIVDVAREVGVNKATVSRALRGIGSPALRERVKETADRLGYSASPSAQALATGDFRVVATDIVDVLLKHHLGDVQISTILQLVEDDRLPLP